ncbi:MAG: hypothetical protein QQN63_10045 [Nitrosopumilus sp.]
MFKFVYEGSEIEPGFSVDRGNKIFFFMIATYKHRWCFRLRYQACKGKFLFTKTHWTLDDDNESYHMRHGNDYYPEWTVPQRKSSEYDLEA